MTGKPLARLLAEHCVQSREPGPELLDWMKLLLFDYLGVTLGGVDRESAVAARASVTLSDARDTVSSALIHGTGLSASPEDAALLNGITAHGLELDDTFEEASLHPAVVIFPALLGVSDTYAIPAGAVLRAAAVGYDVMCAVGVLLGARESYGRGFHPTGVAGALGSAAAVAVALDLNEDQTMHALGLAANMASGSLEFLSDGSWTKRLNAGQAAATGIRAAGLAAAGFLGPEKSLEGRDGFLVQYGRGTVEGRELALSFGQGALHTSIKFYPCCRYMHGNIDLLRSLYLEYPDLRLDEIDSIDVGVIKAGAALVSEPAERKLNVNSAVDAQFSMPFGAALALKTGGATVEQFDNAPAVAGELGGWMAKVRCYSSDALEAAFPAQWQAEIRLRLKDGRVVERHEQAFRGSPGDRPTWDDVEVKIAALVGPDTAKRLAADIFGANPDEPLTGLLEANRAPMFT